MIKYANYSGIYICEKGESKYLNKSMKMTAWQFIFSLLFVIFLHQLILLNLLNGEFKPFLTIIVYLMYFGCSVGALYFFLKKDVTICRSCQEMIVFGNLKILHSEVDILQKGKKIVNDIPYTTYEIKDRKGEIFHVVSVATRSFGVSPVEKFFQQVNIVQKVAP